MVKISWMLAVRLRIVQYTENLSIAKEKKNAKS